MFSLCSAKRRASDKDLPALWYLKLNWFLFLEELKTLKRHFEIN